MCENTIVFFTLQKKKKNPPLPGRGEPTSIAMTMGLWPWSHVTHSSRSPHTHGHGREARDLRPSPMHCPTSLPLHGRDQLWV